MPKIKKTPGEKIIKPGVDLTADKADKLKAKLLKFLDKTPNKLILDCEKVKEIDPVGLSVVVAAHNTLGRKNANFGMINIRNDIYDQLKQLGIDQNIDLQAGK